MTKQVQLKTAVVDFLSQPAHQLLHKQLCEHRHGSYEELVRNLFSHLSDCGFQPRMFLAKGFKGDLTDAHPSWREFAGPKNPIMHIVLRVGNLVIDPAGAQFGPKYGNTMFRSINDFKTFWKRAEDRTEKFLGEST